MIRGCMRTLASALLTAAAAIAVYPASRTAACTSPPMEYQRGYIQASSYVDRKPNIAERTETADIVVLGTVTEVLGPEFTLQTAMIEVDSYLKGDAGPRQVEIRGFGRPSLCKSSIPAAGTSVIVFASGDPYSPMSAHYSPWRNSSGDITTYRGHNNAVAQASAENIQKVSAAADQPQARPSVTPVTPPPTPTPEATATPTTTPTFVPTPTPTATTIFTPTPPPTPTPSAEPTHTPTPTLSPTRTPTREGGCTAGNGGASKVAGSWLLLGLLAPSLALAGRRKRASGMPDVGKTKALL